MNGATPDGAWAGVKTTTATAAPRFSLASRSSVADRPHRHRAVLRLDHDPDVAAPRDPGVEGQHEVALLGLHERAGLRPGPVEQVAGAAGQVGEHRFEQVLEVAALGRRSGSLGAASGGGCLDRHQALLERAEPGGHLLAELVHRRVEPGRIQQQRELGGIAVEVALEHRADPADGAVALRLVEQLVDHRTQGAPVAEEALERARQPAVAVGEVGTQGLLERLRGLVVDRLGLVQELLELGPDDVDVDGHAGVLEGEQADPDRPLDEVRSIVGRTLGQERGEGRVLNDEPVDEDPAGLDPDTRGGRRVGSVQDGQRGQWFGGHGPTMRLVRDSLRVTAIGGGRCARIGGRPPGATRACVAGQLPRYVISEKPLISSGTW